MASGSPGRERQRRLCDDHIRVHQRAVAIGKIQTVGGVRDAPAVGQGGCPRPARRPETVLRRKRLHSSARRRRLCRECRRVPPARKALRPAQTPRRMPATRPLRRSGGRPRARMAFIPPATRSTSPADAAIPHQQVGAVADDRHRRARVFRGVERDGDFIRRNDVHQHVGRPADAQRGILRRRPGARCDPARNWIEPAIESGHPSEKKTSRRD